MSLLQFEDEVMPFSFADVLILRYLFDGADAEQTVKDFKKINDASKLNWSLKSHLVKFINRFWSDPYREEDKMWMKDLVERRGIKVKRKFMELRELVG